MLDVEETHDAPKAMAEIPDCVSETFPLNPNPRSGESIPTADLRSVESFEMRNLVKQLSILI